MSRPGSEGAKDGPQLPKGFKVAIPSSHRRRQSPEGSQEQLTNAGYSNFEPFHSSRLEVQQAMLAVDCTAVVTLAHTFLQQATDGESDGSTLPASMIQSSEEVVEEALAALERRQKPIIMTGLANRMMVGLMPRLLTRLRLLKTLAVIGDPEKALRARPFLSL